jgi:hypothetical protein
MGKEKKIWVLQGQECKWQGRKTDRGEEETGVRKRQG